MSMCFYLRHASQIDIARYVRDGIDPDELAESTLDGFGPGGGFVSTQGMREQIEHWLAGPGAATLAQLPPSQRELLRQQLATIGSQQAVPPPSAGRPHKPRRPLLDLHKSWHMLHFVLTGEAWAGPMPAATLLVGGREVGDDLGYGPARAISPAETAAFAAFLAPLDAATLAPRLDVARMLQLGIYCVDGSDPAARAELQDDLEHYFSELRDFVAGAAARGQGLLAWLS